MARSTEGVVLGFALIGMGWGDLFFPEYSWTGQRKVDSTDQQITVRSTLGSAFATCGIMFINWSVLPHAMIFNGAALLRILCSQNPSPSTMVYKRPFSTSMALGQLFGGFCLFYYSNRPGAAQASHHSASEHS